MVPTSEESEAGDDHGDRDHDANEPALGPPLQVLVVRVVEDDRHGRRSVRRHRAFVGAESDARQAILRGHGDGGAPDLGTATPLVGRAVLKAADYACGVRHHPRGGAKNERGGQKTHAPARVQATPARRHCDDDGGGEADQAGARLRHDDAADHDGRARGHPQRAGVGKHLDERLAPRRAHPVGAGVGQQIAHGDGRPAPSTRRSDCD